MAETEENSQIVQSETMAFSVRQRLAWAAKPLGLLFLLFWIFHPYSTAHAEYVHLPLVGFLAGICYGLLAFWESLRDYIGLTHESHRFAVNRVPAEYYWGIVSEVLFHNK